jgi:hypothetical protein
MPRQYFICAIYPQGEWPFLGETDMLVYNRHAQETSEFKPFRYALQSVYSL